MTNHQLAIEHCGGSHIVHVSSSGEPAGTHHLPLVILTGTWSADDFTSDLGVTAKPLASPKNCGHGHHLPSITLKLLGVSWRPYNSWILMVIALVFCRFHQGYDHQYLINWSSYNPVTSLPKVRSSWVLFGPPVMETARYLHHGPVRVIFWRLRTQKSEKLGWDEMLCILRWCWITHIQV